MQADFPYVSQPPTSVLAALLAAAMLSFAAASAFPLSRSPLQSAKRNPQPLTFLVISEPNDAHTVSNLPYVYVLSITIFHHNVITAFCIQMHARRRYALLGLGMLLMSAADPVMDGMYATRDMCDV